MRKVEPVMNAPLSLIKSSATFAASSAVPGRPAGALSEHVLVEVAARAVELVERQRRDDDAGGDVVQARAALAPFDRLRRDALLVAALRHLIGMERVTDVLGLQKVEGQQLLRRRGGELFVVYNDFHTRAHAAGDGHADLSGTGP